MKRFITIFGIVFTSLFLPLRVLAVSISFSNFPASVDQNQEIEVDISLACSGCSDSYIRGAFYPGGTNNYFGFTQNKQGEWIGTASDKTQYFKVSEGELQEGSWSGKIKVKPDPADSAYSGPGSYQFKFGRYTSGGSVTWSSEITTSITGPAPTSTPTPTPTPGPTNTPTPTPTKTPTPTPTSQVTPTPTPKKSPTPTPTPSPVLTGTPTPTPEPEGQILGETTSEPTPPPEATGSQQKSLLPIIITLLLLGIGCALLAFVGVWQRAHIRAFFKRS